MSSDQGRDVAVVVDFLVNRRLNRDELFAALEVSSSTFYEWRDKGHPVPADNLLKAARNLGINPIELLITCGYLLREDVIDFLGSPGAEKRGLATIELGARRRVRRTDTQPMRPSKTVSIP